MATVTAISCSQTDVNAVINGSTHTAVDGDTILVPGSTCNTAGTAASWSGTLTINAAITLDGQGANINMGTSGSPAIQVNANTTGNTSVTGFVTTGQRPAGSCAINITTSNSPLTKTYRLHDNTATGGGGTWTCHNGFGPGLIDHNTITWGSGEIIHNLGRAADQNAGWLDDVTPGGPNMLFMEDNTFTNTSTTTVNGPTTNYYGMRVVFRHNTVNLGTVDGHAGNTTNGTGTRWMEVYQNTFQYKGTDTGCWAHAVDMRGGSGVIWGNTMTAGGPACSSEPALFTGPYVPSSDPGSGTWPLPWQSGRGFQTTSGSTGSQQYSPVQSWGNTGFLVSGPQLNAQGNTNGNFVIVGTGPSACGTFHPGGVCDGIVASGPTGLLRCQSAADVAAGCPFTYNYVPFTYPHPLTGGSGGSFQPPPILVQHNSLDAGVTTSASLAFLAPSTAGNFIAVVIRTGANGQTFTITDSVSNTYQHALNQDTSGGETLAIYYAENIEGGADTVTVTDTVSSTLRFIIIELSGIKKFSSLDVIASANGTSVSPSSGNLTTTVSGDALVGGVVSHNAATFTVGTGYSLVDSSPAEPNTRLMVELLPQPNAGPASATATLGVSDSWAIGLAAFKAAAQGGTHIGTVKSFNVTIF